MPDLFRYMQWRAPETADVDANAIQITGDSPFRAGLRRARQGQHPVDEVTAAARDFVKSPQFATSPDALGLGDAYARAREAAETWTADHHEPLAKRLAAVFDVTSLSDLVQSPPFRADKTQIHDSLIAAKILAAERRQDLPALVGLARGLYVTERAGAGDPRTTTAAGVARLLEALVSIPEEYLLLDRTPASTPTPAVPPTDTEGEVTALQRRQQSLQQTYELFSSLDAESFASHEERGAAPHAIAAPQPAAAAMGPAALAAVGHAMFATPTAAAETLSTLASAVSHQLFVREDVANRFPTAVRDSLANVRVDAHVTPVPEITRLLKTELQQVQRQLLEKAPLRATPVYQLGQYFFTLSSAPKPASFLGPAPQLKIQPAGFGDLQVVKQQIVRYEAGEISFVENVMKGEHYGREVSRREMQEEIAVSERERVKEEERDLQATDRFELHTETENTARNSTTTTSGNTITTQYGNFVEGHKSDFARDVVNRSVNRLTERVREQRTVRLQRELIEQTKHGFDNASNDNVSGIYQWVDKISIAQVYNFGKRLLYEAVIPEPAAFLIDLRRKAGQPEGFTLVKPVPPAFGPRDLQAWNYLDYAKLYDVVGAVEPPPEEYKQVTKGLGEKWDSDQFTFKADSIPIPEGYVASSIAYYRFYNHSFTSGSYLSLAAGYNEVFSNTYTLRGETETLPLYVAAKGNHRLVVNLMIFCQRTAAHLEKWQLRTYEALMKGYRKQRSEYEDRLANLQAIARTQALLGGGGGRNRELERTELKKAFLTLLTNQHFDSFGGVETSFPWLYSQTNIHAAVNQAGVISFFERAFEWENMLYFFYPYFWGRKAQWDDLVVLQDPDPQFEAFLKAGAARVVVPVRPGFEAALAHYIETGQVWQGEDEPNMYSPLYVSILQEIKDRDKAPGDEIPVGEPWEVRLPTTLVMLRRTPTLPEWEQGADGKWVPKP